MQPYKTVQHIVFLFQTYYWETKLEEKLKGVRILF